jgi:hypothetical protein
MTAVVWMWLKRIPAALWAATGAALAILLLVLRGRHLEAELAKTRLAEQAARARAVGAKSEGVRVAHEAEAARSKAEAEELEHAAKRVSVRGSEEEQRIAALPSGQVQSEYVKMAQAARERAKQRMN